jgi:hypothetical protein
MLMLAGNNRIPPSKLLISPTPAGGLAGTEVRGSGNWGTPCPRMHTAILRNFSSVCADGLVDDPGPDGPPPMSFRHFACAAWNAGADVSTPVVLKSGPWAFGSGKLGTPLARMHSANASGPEPPPPDRLECELAAVDAVVRAPPAVAVVELGAPAPQPATSTIPLRTAPKARRRARGERVDRSALSRIWSPSSVLRGVRIGCTRRAVSSRLPP